MKKKREANFELLRILAMFMVVVLHYLSHADALVKLGVPATRVEIVATLIEALNIVAVNVWVLISGYFLSETGFRIKRIIILIAQIYFYTICVSFVMMATNVYVVHTTDSVYKLVQYIFPIESEHYWFATSYVILYVLAPVLNAGIEKLTRNQLRVVIMGLLLWFSLIKTIVPVVFATDHFGYDFGWFICLYLIAGYIKKYNVVLFYDAKKSLMVYLGSVFIIFAAVMGVYYINLYRGGLVYYFTVPFHYNFIFCLTGALGIFSLFRFIRIKEGRFADIVRRIAPYTFGVYLLHEHLEIRDRWLGWMEGIFGNVPRDSVILFIVNMILCVTAVFVAGVFIDWIRAVIFNYIRRVMRNSGATRLFDRIDISLRD